MKPEIDELLEHIRAELLRIREANETGTITVHCGLSQYVIETNSKKPPIKHIKQNGQVVVTAT